MSEEDQESNVQPAFSPAPPELSGKKPLNFTSTIARLEMRATAARKRARWAGMLLVLGVYGIVGVLSYNLIRGESNFKYGELVSFRSDSRQTIESPFARRVAHIMKQLVGPESAYEAERVKFVPPDKEAAAALKVELKEALADLEKAIQIADIGKKSESATGSIAPIVSTAVFSIGAVGILILMIQISVMFIRYHLRLGELYDAQSDALRASGGDAPLAYALLQHLSPNAIEVGRAPASLYEKALEAIQAVASSKRAP